MENVRMGELKVVTSQDGELGAIGLGSCIGLALLDQRAGVAAMAHIVLPESRGNTEPAGKFADTAVPALIDAVLAAGGRRHRLEAVMAGGARMFAMGSSQDVGARNTEATLEELKRARIAVSAQDTGGEQGRTLRIIPGHAVTSQRAGGPRIPLLQLIPPRTPAAVRMVA